MNILTFCTHEAWQTNLAKTGHNFYLLKSVERPSGWKLEECQVPINFCFDFDINNINFDCIISNTVFDQRQDAIKLSRKLNLPIIEMEHCLPHDGLKYNELRFIKDNCPAKIKVFTTKCQAKEWGYFDGDSFEVVGHCPDPMFLAENWSRKNTNVLSVAYDFRGRGDILGYDEWEAIVGSFNSVHVGEEKIATKDELAKKYYSGSAVFLNTAKRSTLPTSLLEAMAVGIPTVSWKAGGLEFIENEVNGFISNDILEMIDIIDFLIKDEKRAKQIGLNGKNTIIEQFSINSFVEKWNSIFKRIKDE